MPVLYTANILITTPLCSCVILIGHSYFKKLLLNEYLERKENIWNNTFEFFILFLIYYFLTIILIIELSNCLQAGQYIIFIHLLYLYLYMESSISKLKFKICKFSINYTYLF